MTDDAANDDVEFPVAITIFGAPRTKKNSSRLVRTGRFSRILPSKAYEDWNKHSAWLPAHPARLPDQPYNVRATVYREANRGDLIGYLQAIADSLEDHGVLSDDKWICSWDGSRMTKDAKRPRVEILIEPMAFVAVA